jgi:ethanolamine utilization protein EutJ
MAFDLFAEFGSMRPEPSSERGSAPDCDLRVFLVDAADRLRAPATYRKGPLRFGVDLGTATVVIAAIDSDSHPVYWNFLPCEAVRDGVVLHFAEAVAAVGALRSEAASALGVVVAEAATAFPPGVAEAEARGCRYVLENAGLTCRGLVDEISAAQALLRIDDGAIADVGGGSTGVGVVANGQLVSLTDAPGGGYHLDLIVAGALRIPVDEAERRKRGGEPGLWSILRPGIERIASSIAKQIAPRSVEIVHLVGGAVRVPNATEIIGSYLGIPTVGYPHSELVTPYGIAMS